MGLAVIRRRAVPKKVYTFPASLTENPLSDSGRWVLASQMSPRTALRSSGGNIFGTAPAYANDNVYPDSAGHLLDFSSNHEIEATFVNNGASDLEVEFFVRADFTAAHTFGYEIDFYKNSGICSLVRWDGTSALPNVFVFLRNGEGHEGEAPCISGDKARVRIVNTLISVFYRPVATGIESELFHYDIKDDAIQYRTGQPGAGTFTNAGGTPSGNLALSGYTARDI